MFRLSKSAWKGTINRREKYVKRRRYILALLLFATLNNFTITLQAQRRQTRQTPTASRTAKPAQPPVASRSPKPVLVIPVPAASRLTGLYSLDAGASDDPRVTAERVTGNLAFGMEQGDVERLVMRLTSPQHLAIEQRGTSVSIASTRSPRITFNADGRERTEQATDGHQLRTRAVLYGDELMVSSTGNRDDEFRVTFDPIDATRLRVTRRIYDDRLDRPLVIQSIYKKVSGVARWNIYGTPETAAVAARSNQQYPRTDNRTSSPQPLPPVNNQSAPPPGPPAYRTERGREESILYVPAGTQFVATLDNDLSTNSSNPGDRFTMTVRAPVEYQGATLEGRVSSVSRGGRLSGRAQMALDFQQIRLRDGRTAEFEGTIESIRTADNEDVRVNNEEGNVQESDSQTRRTTQRATIGAAVGAIIGAIADGGKGAAIGAAIGAGSVYVQGRDDLELKRGSEITVSVRGAR